MTLLASRKSGSLLSPPPPHTSEPFFSSSNPRDFQLLNPPPPHISSASESFFSNPDNSDTSSLPLWTFPKCDTVISFSETTSARGVQTSHCAQHSALHSAQSALHSEMFALVTTAHLCSPFDSLGQKSNLTGTTDLFSCSVKAQGCHGLSSSLMNRAERKMGSRHNRWGEKYYLG